MSRENQSSNQLKSESKKPKSRLKELRAMKQRAISRANSYEAWTKPKGSAAHKKAMKGFKRNSRLADSIGKAIQTEHSLRGTKGRGVEYVPPKRKKK